MNIFMYTNRFGVYMAGKLYWRIKKDGKWTWKPAVAELIVSVEESYWKIQEEEE